jgi:hypothetical protein
LRRESNDREFLSMAPSAAQIELRFRHRALEELPTCLQMGKNVPSKFLLAVHNFTACAALIDH